MEDNSDENKEGNQDSMLPRPTPQFWLLPILPHGLRACPAQRVPPSPPPGSSDSADTATGEFLLIRSAFQSPPTTRCKMILEPFRLRPERERVFRLQRKRQPVGQPQRRAGRQPRIRPACTGARSVPALREKIFPGQTGAAPEILQAKQAHEIQAQAKRQ